jgi:hypothetical protein
MILGMLIRRWQIIQSGSSDPITVDCDDHDQSKITLRLVHVLEQALGSALRESAVQWIINRRIIHYVTDLGSFLDSLKAALLGDYKVIVDLTRALDGGTRNKLVVDVIIDQCAMCLNLREQILLYRLKGLTPKDDGSFLNLASSYLERYTKVFL